MSAFYSNMSASELLQELYLRKNDDIVQTLVDRLCYIERHYNDAFTRLFKSPYDLDYLDQEVDSLSSEIEDLKDERWDLKDEVSALTKKNAQLEATLKVYLNGNNRP